MTKPVKQEWASFSVKGQKINILGFAGLCLKYSTLCNKKAVPRSFLLVQWLRIHLAMQGTQVRSLVRELRSHMLRSN